MKLNGEKEQPHFNKIASKDTKICLDVLVSSHERFVGLCCLDLESETFSKHHFHNEFRTIFDFKCFFENLKNGLIGATQGFWETREHDLLFQGNKR